MGELTGRKVLIITVAGFGVVVAANLALAISAVRTFPGLETKNSYVASQTFDANRDAQEALGWAVEGQLDDGWLVVAVTDAEGAPVELGSISGTFGRPTHVKDDQTPEFAFDGVRYAAPVTTAPGMWNFRMDATALDGTAFRQRIELYVKE